MSGTLLIAVLAAAAWWGAAPPALGGSTTLVAVDGTSMLPGLRPDDLVALRPRRTYRAGDVVGYRSALMGRVVLHRVVAVRRGRLTLRGDNNSYLDPEQPGGTQVIGRLWIRVPTAGSLLASSGRPWVLAVLGGTLVLVAGLRRPTGRAGVGTGVSARG